MKLKLNSSSPLTLQFLSTSLFWTQTPHLDSMLDQERCDVIRGVESVDQQPSDWWMMCEDGVRDQLIVFPAYVRDWPFALRADRSIRLIDVRLIHSIRLLEWLVLTSHWITNIHIKIILMQTFLLYIIQSFLIGSCHWCFLAMTRMFQTPCRACHHMGGASAHITNLSTTRWQQRLSTTCYDLQGEGHVNKPS